MSPQAAGTPADRRAAPDPWPSPNPGLPASALEVRVAADRLEVMEFHSRDGRRRLREALERLGLVLDEVFDSPCG